jgi:hypothetical protein
LLGFPALWFGCREEERGGRAKEATSTGNNNTKLNHHLANGLSRYSIFNHLLDSAVF